MPATLLPTTELVAVAWLKGVTGLPTSAIGTTLPTDNSTWAASGFVQVQTVGGTPNLDVQIAEPIVQIDGWANNGTSKKPAWGRANNLLELVRAGCYAADISRVVTLPTDYPDARVLSAYLVTEPRRIPDVDSSYARYSADLQLFWVLED